jgi:hypothetical protein
MKCAILRLTNKLSANVALQNAGNKKRRTNPAFGTAWVSEAYPPYGA